VVFCIFARRCHFISSFSLLSFNISFVFFIVVIVWNVVVRSKGSGLWTLEQRTHTFCFICFPARLSLTFALSLSPTVDSFSQPARPYIFISNNLLIHHQLHLHHLIFCFSAREFLFFYQLYTFLLVIQQVFCVYFIYLYFIIIIIIIFIITVLSWICGSRFYFCHSLRFLSTGGALLSPPFVFLSS